MKTALTCLLLAGLAIPAQAASLETYLAARDRDIAAANRAKAPLSDTAEERARTDLERQIKQILPPFRAAGFSPEGKSNLASLTQEQGFGQLDGLVYTSKDEKTSVLVTSTPLLERWIKGHADWWPNDVNVPQTVDAALKAEVLYTQAISTDAAVDKFADVPVAKPAEASFATVMLDIRRQDISIDMPNEIIAAVIRGDTVFIASQPVAKALTPIPACEAIWNAAQAKSDAAQAVYQKSQVGDQAAFDAAQKIATDGDEAHRRCIGEKLRDHEAFPALVGQAQALVDLLK